MEASVEEVFALYQPMLKTSLLGEGTVYTTATEASC